MPRFTLWAVLVALAFSLTACTGDTPSTPDGDDGPLVIYSGRKDVLVDPIVQRFREETGLEVEVRYGTDAELLSALQEEGAASQADIFWANTAGTLGAALEADLLTALPDSLLGMAAAFVPSSKLWAPATVRFRTVAYAPGRVDTTMLPSSVMDLPSVDALRGRIGWTPTYASFYDFIAAMEREVGDREAIAWIEGMKALEPKAYASNTPMLEALAAGEIDVALTNHYYILRMLHSGADETETSAEEAPVGMYHFAAGDLGNLALVTGAGVLQTSRKPDMARQFIAHLLAPESQQFSADVVHEYPVVRGITVPDYFLPFDQAVALSPSIGFERLYEIQRIAQLLRDQGLQ